MDFKWHRSQQKYNVKGGGYRDHRANTNILKGKISYS
ncbi:hypothetical protein Xmau_00544 [Xenorhabdus mauleonii]|uniref:Uncharacterized protein n=1 Tax=Xenorhabdus mauleonii TaxID=351675 RepID=A0A1I3JA21_9GAMM|nr:hypothetical protein Xmau_00544 [Xenorhabdus mauleonii]SFI57151.1 hypothetical protein SAMN05421680_102139 [Xenorhabdus mauleonii]